MLRDLDDDWLPMSACDPHRADLLVLRSLEPGPLAPARNKSSTAQHILKQLVCPGKRPITFVRLLPPTNAPRDSRTGTACVAAGSSSDGCIVPAGPQPGRPRRSDTPAPVQRPTHATAVRPRPGR